MRWEKNGLLPKKKRKVLNSYLIKPKAYTDFEFQRIEEYQLRQ